jgi:mannose/fructose-specific phosphotransferase system component IIA
MKKYTNIVVINGINYPNIIEASNYKDALKQHKAQKQKSKNTFKCRLTIL